MMDAVGASEHDDDRAGREERAREVETLFPIPDDGMFILGGLEAGLAFEEMRQAYIYGLWLSTIFNAVAAIERHVGSALHMMGEGSVSRMSFSQLTDSAAQVGHISDYEKAKFNEIYEVRDSYARFREPIEMVERLAEEGRMGTGINELLQSDARMALTLACGYFERNYLS